MDVRQEFEPHEGASLRKERMIAAFARAASTIAWEGSLQVVLDRLAEEVLVATNARACSISLVSRFGNSLDLVGAAGYPEGYLERTRAAIALGAPVLTLRAYHEHTTVVSTMKDLLTGDPRFAPYVEMVKATGWAMVVSTPLMLHDETVGALTTLYAEERKPDDSEIAFLRAMADHGAIAVNTARLLTETQQKAAQDERNRLARDVHDAVSQALFSMRMRIRALQMVAERDQDVHHLMGPGLSALGATVDRAVDDMRALVMHLRPHDLRSNGLAEAIRLYAETISDRDAILLEIGVQGELPTLPRTTEQEIYLVAREAIGNSVDHAKATRLGVQLSTLWLDGAGHVVLEVTDDGIGFDANRARPGHLGLTSMRARAAQIGAELTIDSSPAGTTVRLQVPMPAGGRRGND